MKQVLNNRGKCYYLHNVREVSDEPYHIGELSRDNYTCMDQFGVPVPEIVIIPENQPKNTHQNCLIRQICLFYLIDGFRKAEQIATIPQDLRSSRCGDYGYNSYHTQPGDAIFVDRPFVDPASPSYLFVIGDWNTLQRRDELAQLASDNMMSGNFDMDGIAYHMIRQISVRGAMKTPITMLPLFQPELHPGFLASLRQLIMAN